MRIHRFLVEMALEAGEGSILKPELVHQIGKVLHLVKGEQIELFNKEGEYVIALITEISERQVDFIVLDKEKKTDAGRRVVLAAAVVKRDNFEWIVQKATEIGVAEIIPLLTDHSVKFGVQLHRLKRIAEEAVEQCGRVSVPVIREPEKFIDVLNNSKEDNKYFFDGTGKNLAGKISGSAILFVGPEGGWSPNEKKLAKEAGCKFIKLGENVLRAETAATVASYLVVNK